MKMEGNEIYWEKLISIFDMRKEHKEYLMQLLINLDSENITYYEKKILILVTCVVFKILAPKLPENFKVLDNNVETKAVEYKSKFSFLIKESDFDEALPEIVNIISDDIAAELNKMLEQKIINSVYMLIKTGEEGFRDLQIIM
jgi:hypothetical protein